MKLKKKKLVLWSVAILVIAAVAAFFSTRKEKPPVLKTDGLGGGEAKVVLKLTKEGMDAARATRNSDAKLRKVTGRMSKEEFEQLKLQLAALQETEFRDAEIIRYRTDPNRIEIRLTNGAVVFIFKNNNRYQITGCTAKKELPPSSPPVQPAP